MAPSDRLQLLFAHPIAVEVVQGCVPVLHHAHILMSVDYVPSRTGFAHLAALLSLWYVDRSREIKVATTTRHCRLVTILLIFHFHYN